LNPVKGKLSLLIRVTVCQRKTFTFFLPILLILGFLLACKTKSSSATVSSSPSQNYTSSPEEVKFKGFFINACKEKALGNNELALDQLKEALKVFPKNAAANYEMACIYKLISKTDEALPFAKSAVQNDAKNEWYHLLLIDCLHDKRKYKDAALACEKLISINPNNPAFYDQLAREHGFAGNYSKALNAYSNRSKKFGADPETRLEIVKLYRITGKRDKAEKELLALVQEFPNETNYYTYLAELYQENREDEKALKIYHDLKQKDPRNPYVHLAIADYYRTRNQDSLFMNELRLAFEMPELDIEEKRKIMISFYSVTEDFPEHRKSAMELCKIMVEQHPDDARAHGIYGDFLNREEKYTEAREQYEQAIKSDKNVFGIWTEIMKIDVSLGDYPSLERHSDEAKELFLAQPVVLYYNAVAKMQLKKNKEAIATFLEAKEFIVDDEELLGFIMINLGEIYNTEKEFEKSDKAFDEALRIDPENASLLNNYSYYLSLRKEKLPQAEKMASKAVQLNKNSSTFLDTYAWVLYQQGKYQEAQAWLQKAIENGGDENGVILEHYGDALFKNNKVEQALDSWKKALEKPKHSEQLEKKISEKKISE
jgi:tetratricopeptide (TPR) repeat protein